MAWILFQPPDADPTQQDGVYAFSVNSHGDCCGYFVDSSGKQRGFIRNFSDGSFIEFDAAVDAHNTNPWCINDYGVVCGEYRQQTTNTIYGFIRAANGTISIFSVPGASTHSFEGTFCHSINNNGDVAGAFTDSGGGQNNIYIRYVGGSFITDSPSGGTFVQSVTVCLNDSGSVMCTFGNDTYYQVYLRNPDATTVIINAPGAGTNFGDGTFTYQRGIDNNGQIAGNVVSDIITNAFLRDFGGTFTLIDLAGSTGAATATNVNPGVVVGTVLFDDNSSQGFLYTPETQAVGGFYQTLAVYHGFLYDGTLTTIDAPGAGVNPGNGTIVFDVNGGGSMPPILIITANDQTKLFGTTFVFDGTEFTNTPLLPGDSIVSCTITSTGSPSSAPVGTYPIEISNAIIVHA